MQNDGIINSLKEMLSRSESQDVINHCDPEGPAKQAYQQALQILDFYNHDLYNP